MLLVILIYLLDSMHLILIFSTILYFLKILNILKISDSFIMKCIVLLMLVANLQQLFATYSGLYMDNGRDQTMIERRMTRREKQKFERELLHLLGLPKKPKRTLRSSTLTSSAPKFLLEVYKSLDGGKLKNDFNLKSEDYRSVKESDAIMTFLTKS